ncbi:MAG: xanthine dehydrogenase family protein molybdopterin-binding subunit, partial [Mangrovicoccus sp.]
DMPRIELPKKTQGSVGLFGLDYKPEGILYAVTARSPKFGGMVASVDDAAARAMAGVVDVITIPQGVVVLAEDTWTAMQAREELLIEWDFSQAETRGTDQMIADYRALLDQPGKPGLARGDAAGALAGAETVIEADYVFPFLAHAPLEPLNATIEYDGQSAKLTYGSQFQTVDHGTVAAVLGLPMEKIQIVTTWAGGSFGRRATLDGHLAAETAMLGKAWFDKHGAARPIKLTYSREDDILGGYYRPLAVHRVRAAVGADGKIAGWEQRVVSKSIFIGTAFEPYVVHEGVDHMTIEGLMDRYAVADVSIEAHHPETALPVLWWRSVGHSFAGYVAETMMDELADAAGQDPVEFRLAHLGEAPREAAVLRLAAEKAGWGEALPEGRYRGVAVQKSFDSYVAQVAEISLREDGTVKVEKVTAAVDCGVPINPDNIRAQIQGGLGMGLGTVLREEITLTDGEVDQWNYPDYQPLRITDMPEVEVHIMASSEAPTGIGEPGLPPIGPAVANAVYRATGQRVRELPFAKHGLA